MLRSLLPALLLTASVAAQTPEDDPRAALLAMGERLAMLDACAVEIHRVTVIETASGEERAESVTHLAWEQPNRVRSVSERPEGRTEVVCDGERLVIWQEGHGTVLDQPASATLAAIERQTEGLVAEGLALGGLFFAEDPTAALTEGFEAIHDLGGTDLEGTPCRLVGLDDPNGLRMVVWLDATTWLPRQATLDASAVLRDAMTGLDLSNRDAVITVTETHRAVRLNPTDLDFDLPAPSAAPDD